MLMLIKIMLKLNNEVHIHVRCGRAAMQMQMQTQSCRHRGVPIPSRRGAFAARAWRSPSPSGHHLPMHRFLSDTLAHAPCHALLLTTWGMQLDFQKEALKPCVGLPEMLTMHGYVSVA